MHPARKGTILVSETYKAGDNDDGNKGYFGRVSNYFWTVELI